MINSSSLNMDILREKDYLINVGINPITTISFLDQSFKRIIKYYFLFSKSVKETSFFNSPKNAGFFMKFIRQSWSSLSYKNLERILNFYQIKKDENILKQIENIFNNRNSQAHTNIHISKNINNYYAIFYIVNKLKEKILVLLQEEYSTKFRWL